MGCCCRLLPFILACICICCCCWAWTAAIRLLGLPDVRTVSRGLRGTRKGLLLELPRPPSPPPLVLPLALAVLPTLVFTAFGGG